MGAPVRRFLPDDFHPDGPTMSLTAIRKRWKMGHAAAARLVANIPGRVKVRGAPVGPKKLERPADFEMHAHKRNAELIAMYGCGVKIIQRWRAQIGVATPRPTYAPAPNDLAEMARSMTLPLLCAHYDVERSAMSRMLRRAGLTAYTPEATGRTWGPLAIPPRDDSRAGQAAEYLKTRGWSPVCKARTIKITAAADEWVAGREVLKADALIALAAKIKQRVSA